MFSDQRQTNGVECFRQKNFDISGKFFSTSVVTEKYKHAIELGQPASRTLEGEGLSDKV
jgi:hypothetical protein